MLDRQKMGHNESSNKSSGYLKFNWGTHIFFLSLWLAFDSKFYWKLITSFIRVETCTITDPPSWEESIKKQMLLQPALCCIKCQVWCRESTQKYIVRGRKWKIFLLEAVADEGSVSGLWDKIAFLSGFCHQPLAPCHLLKLHPPRECSMVLWLQQQSHSAPGGLHGCSGSAGVARILLIRKSRCMR